MLSIDLAENQNRLIVETSDGSPRYLKQVPREDLTSNSVRLELEAFKASQGPVHIHKVRDSPEDLERNTLLIHRIRKLVSEDAARQPEDRIDCVEIGPEPWPEHLRALDGLSPKHLRVYAGFMEQIDVVELDKLNTKFKLESLCISGVGIDWSNRKRFPEFFTHVKSLILNVCCSITFKGTNLPAHLRQLKIVGNNAMDMFIHAVDNMPNVSEQLEKVFIYTDPQLDMSQAFWLDDFRERLGRCKGLRELTLVVADDYEARAARDSSDPFDVALSRSLPKNIEGLEFHCSNSEPMLADLDLWIEPAKDPEWLPRLKYIHICTYKAEMDEFRYRGQSMPAVNTGRDRMFSEKIRGFYEVLKCRDPLVEVGY